jgi:hypothetical protein
MSRNRLKPKRRASKSRKSAKAVIARPSRTMGKSMRRTLPPKSRRKTPTRAHRPRNKSRREPVPTTARQYSLRSRKFQETWDSVAQVISKMRAEHLSLPKASKEIGVDPAVVLKLGRSALRKQRNGQYVARKADRLLRVLSVLTPEGRREVAIRDSRQASLLGKYWAAVQRYLQTGDDSVLHELTGKKVIDASRKRHVLITDLAQLNRLGSAGVLSFESLYAGVR